jgi:hypothetical protein
MCTHQLSIPDGENTMDTGAGGILRQWTDVHVPFVVVAVAAVPGAAVVVVRRNALTHRAAEPEPGRATGDGVAVLAN